MIAFVKDAESSLEHHKPIRVGQGEVEQLVRGFSADWKKAIDDIDHEVMRSFSNFKNGTAILQVKFCIYLYPAKAMVNIYLFQGALMQLVQYYHRFTKLFSHAPMRSMSVRSELINIHHVMVEVKKHKTAF
jgi:hypothetical protein